INIKTEGRNGDVIGIRVVDETDEFILMTSGGQAIRTYVRDISVIGRNTQGVRIIRLKEGEKVATFAVVPKAEIIEENEDKPEEPKSEEKPPEPDEPISAVEEKSEPNEEEPTQEDSS
ncbi:MAG: DNA gyrase C-terminal beta-propeller domain-containing protein, partial [Candidatus Micrarchaeota archaeon]